MARTGTRALAAAALGGMWWAASCAPLVVGGGGTTSASAGGSGSTGTGGTTSQGGTGGATSTGGLGGTGGGPDSFPPPIGPRSPQVKWALQLATVEPTGFATPAVGPDGTIYVQLKSNVSGDSLAAVDPSGTLKWQVGPVDPTEMDQAPPIVGKGGILYVLASGAAPLIARSSADGHVLWTSPQSFQHVALAPNGTLVGVLNGDLIALSHTGAPLWSKALAGTLSAPAIAPDGTIFVGGYADPVANVVALHPDGNEAWRVDFGEEGVVPGVLVGVDGTLYTGGKRAVRAFSPSGALLWSTELAKQSAFQADPVRVRSDGSLIGSDSTGLYGISHAGRVDWGLHAEFILSLAVDGEGTVFHVDQQLGAIRADGTRAWTFPHAGGVALGPDGTLYLTSGETLYAIADASEPDAGAPDGGTGGGGGGVDLGACGSAATWSADLARDSSAAPWGLADLAVGARGHAFVGLIHVGDGPGRGAVQVVEIDAAGSPIETRTFADAALDQADTAVHMSLDTHGARSPTANIVFTPYLTPTIPAILAPGLRDLNLDPTSIDAPIGNAAGDVFANLGLWGGNAVVRWDASGKQLWSKDAGWYSALLGADDAGDLYLSDDGSGLTDFGCGSLGSARVIKLGPAGQCLWQRQIPAMTVAARLLAAEATSDAYLVDASGQGIDLGCGALPGGGTAYAARITPAGACVWQRRLVGPGIGAARFPSGGLLLSTTFPHPQSADLGGGPVASFTSTPYSGSKTPSDILLTRLGPTGTAAWTRHFGAADVVLVLTRASVDATGAVLLTGTADGPVDFGGGPLDPAGSQFLVKLSGTGAFLWQTQIPAGAMAAPDPCGAPIVAAPTATGFHVTRLAP